MRPALQSSSLDASLQSERAAGLCAPGIDDLAVVAMLAPILAVYWPIVWIWKLGYDFATPRFCYQNHACSCKESCHCGGSDAECCERLGAPLPLLGSSLACSLSSGAALTALILATLSAADSVCMCSCRT